MFNCVFCSFIVAVDVDEEALAVCQQNLSEFEISNVDLIQMNVVKQMQLGDGHRWKGRFDTVIMNPPFGTKGNEGKNFALISIPMNCSLSSIVPL